MSVCCCLQTCNSVANVLVMGLVLGQSLISTTGVLLLCKSISHPLMYYGSALLLFTRKLHCLQTFLQTSDPTYVQNCRPVPPIVYEILGFKLENENDNDDKNWRNGLLPYIPC